MGGRDWMCGILGFLPQRFLADTALPGGQLLSCASFFKLVILKYCETYEKVALP